MKICKGPAEKRFSRGPLTVIWSRLPLILGVLGICFLTACGPRDEAWTRIEREGVLHVGLDPTFPPFEVTADSGVEGFDVDLARELAEELGLEATFTYFGYDGLYDALTTEQVDVLISALVIVPERTRDFAYSEPYFNAGEILITRSTAVQEMGDLDGRRLAVELGALGHVEATQWAKRLPQMVVTPYGSAQEALEAVAAGDADAALVDGVSGRLYLKSEANSALSLAPEPVTVEPYAVVVRIEDETLLAKINGALTALKASGALDELSAQWFGP